MSVTTDARLSPSQRLGRGLKYTAVGPVDITRGALGVGMQSVASTASWAGDRYRKGRAAEQLRADLATAQDAIAHEIAAAQEVVSQLPASLKKARARRRRHPLLLVAVGVAALAGGAVVFSIVRRSIQPEPSTLPPSVDVTPKP
ncbi:cell wall synthesis protein CwsA [Mycolicibacterium sp. XJ1819]